MQNDATSFTNCTGKNWQEKKGCKPKKMRVQGIEPRSARLLRRTTLARIIFFSPFSFPFSFLFLSFPLLSFPFLSFPVARFYVTADSVETWSQPGAERTLSLSRARGFKWASHQPVSQTRPYAPVVIHHSPRLIYICNCGDFLMSSPTAN